MKLNTEVNTNVPRLGEGEVVPDGPVKDTEKPLPLRALLTRPVVVSVANSGVMSWLDITASTLVPLVWSTAVDYGGLSMSPASIGLWLTGFGVINGIFQFFAFPSIVRRFGPRLVFIACVILSFPIYILFPFENMVLRHSSRGRNLVVPLLIMPQLAAISSANMGFGMPSQFLELCARFTEVVRIDKPRYVCSYHLPRPTSDLSALRTDLPKRWRRFSARSGRRLPRRCLHFPSTITSWAEILHMSC